MVLTVVTPSFLFNERQFRFQETNSRVVVDSLLTFRRDNSNGRHRKILCADS